MDVEKKVDNHECRITNLEISDATLKERVTNLVKKMDNLISVIIALIIALLCYTFLGG